MKNNQTDELKRSKTDDKTNQKPADDKKGNKSNKVQFTKDGKPAKDVLGMDEQEGEEPADKTQDKKQSPKTESKTGKNNLHKGGL